jgi:hypothetical protein
MLARVRWTVIACLTLPPSLVPLPALAAQQRALTFDDYIALPVVGDPRAFPGGRWVAYTVSTEACEPGSRRSASFQTGLMRVPLLRPVAGR